jgi:hypothetical protein
MDTVTYVPYVSRRNGAGEIINIGALLISLLILTYRSAST